MAAAASDGSVVQISPDGEYLAFSSADGNLKIWETSTGLLSQEYVPSSHLSATCTCLSWCPRRHSRDTPSKKKKKRRSSITLAVEKLDLIALGTTSGSLLLYSVVKGDLHTQAENHNSTINDVCWSADGSTIFTGSEDRHLSEWCLSTATVKQKWKDGKNPVHAVALLPDQKHLLSASRKIKLWDIEKKAVIMNFAGHSMEVRWLMPLQTSCENGGESPISYFLSATPHERHISVWQMSSSSSSVKQALASFSLPHEPAYLHLRPPTQEGQPFLLLVVTKTGVLQIFEHTLNGRMKEPVKPRVCVQVACNSSKTPQPVPLLGAYVCDGPERNILMTYGSILKPVFEKKAYGSFESETYLLRDDPGRTTVKEASTASKVRTPEVSQQLTVLAPEHMAPAGPSSQPDGKVKRKRTKSTDLTMEERLNAITIEKPSSDLVHGKHPPQANSLATLLAQGLQSWDKKILNHVLQHKNEKIVQNTVRKLPLPVVVPLVQELSRRMHGHAQSGQTAMIWVKAVLTIHTAYLMSFPQLVDSFSGLYRMMESRVTVFGHLSKLQGKLDLMVSQLSSQDQEEDDGDGAQQPMLVYQDESSDEDLAFNSLIQDNSESEWEDDYKSPSRKESESDSDMEVSEDSDDGD